MTARDMQIASNKLGYDPAPVDGVFGRKTIAAAEGCKIFMMACAGVFHLAAPGTIKERVPPKRWLRIGIAVAIAVFLVILAGYLMDVQTFKKFPRAVISETSIRPGVRPCP